MKTAIEILELLKATVIAEHHGKLTSYGIYDINEALKDLDGLIPNATYHGEPSVNCSCSECVRNRTLDEIHKIFKG